ncbi:MAG: hypothetical protein NTV34_16785 [Proteobacteria bacterium]|nr:hypothetical protein [Pseudomonadota bacterium]
MNRTVFLVVALVSGCATTVTALKGSDSVRVGKSDPSNNCKDLGTVTAGATSVSPAGSLDEGQRIDMKNQTFQKGGNYLRLDTIESGTAFNCP